MLIPEKMVKVRTYVLDEDKGKFLDELQHLGLIHITPVKIDLNDVKTNYEMYSSMINEVRKIARILNIEKSGNIIEEKNVKDEFEKLKPIIDEVDKLINQRSKLEIKLDELTIRYEDIKKINQYGIKDYPKIPNNWTINGFIISAKKSKEFEMELVRVYKDILIEMTTKKGKTLVLIVYPKNMNINKVLNNYDVKPIYAPIDIKEEKKRYVAGIRAIKDRIKRINEELKNIKKKYEKDIARMYKTLKFYVERESVLFKFKKSSYFIIMEGWLPKKDLKKFKQDLNEKFRNKIEIEILQTDELPPTKLDNPKIAKPFEFLVKFTSIPKAVELDPSSIYLFTIPFLFGMIIGDVIYSLISFLFASYLERKFKHPAIKGFSNIWKFSSLFGVFWGVLFNEWMGKTIGFWLKLINIQFEYSPFIERLHDINALLLLTIFTGIIHICLGFILGAYKEYIHNHKKHALAKIMWIGLIIGGTITVAGLLYHVVSNSITVAFAGLLIFSLLIIVLIEGAPGFFEIFGVMGNIFSYTRIAAVGISGVVLAEMINEFFAPKVLDLQGLIVIPILLILHFANAILAMFESLVHGGRLNLVEFAGKFFTGGGYLYKPFSIKENER